MNFGQFFIIFSLTIYILSLLLLLYYSTFFVATISTPVSATFLRITSQYEPVPEPQFLSVLSHSQRFFLSECLLLSLPIPCQCCRNNRIILNCFIKKLLTLSQLHFPITCLTCVYYNILHKLLQVIFIKIYFYTKYTFTSLCYVYFSSFWTCGQFFGSGLL